MKNKGKPCSTPNCSSHAACKGLCWKHYQQMRLKGKIREKDYVYIEGVCKIIGCDHKIFAKGFCQNHYLQDRRPKDGSR